MPYKHKKKCLRTYRKKLVAIYTIYFNKKDFAIDFYQVLSFLKSNGIIYRWLNYDLNYVDNNYNNEFIKGVQNDIIYLYIPSITYFSKLGNLLKGLKEKNSFIIVGGFPTLTEKASEILNLFDAIDVFVRSPDEERALFRLIKGIREKQDLESLGGVTFRQCHTNNIITNPSPPLSKDMNYIDSLEFLEQEIFDNDPYPLVTSRGCNYNCQYCGLQVPYQINHTQETNFWRTRSPAKIVDEMERLISRGRNRFRFYCEQFISPKEASFGNEYMIEIANEILIRKLKPKFSFTAKASDLVRTFDCLFILKEAGLECVEIGIESGIKRFHRIYKTGTSVHDNLEILKKMHKHLFTFDINFVFFDPYLTIEEVLVNLEFLKKISRYFSHLSMPYCGYLDSGILNSTLILRYGMPIIQKLKKDKLIIETPDFSEHPQIKFKDSRVEKIHSIYKVLKKNVIPSVSPIYYNKALEEKNHFLNLFPLKVMRKIVTDVVENRVTSIPKYVLDTASYLKNYVKRKNR